MTQYSELQKQIDELRMLIAMLPDADALLAETRKSYASNLTGHITSIGNAAVLGSFTSAQLLTALTDETGTGASVFASSPALVTPTITLESVTAPTLLNSWVDYGGALLVSGYYKDAFGIVHLQGTIKSGTIGLSAFTLPAGYRPSAGLNFSVDSNGAFGELAVLANGNVVPSVGSNAYVALDGITFRVA